VARIASSPSEIHSPKDNSGKRINLHDDLLEKRSGNLESLLIISDNWGYVHYYMDGWYSLGSWYAGIGCSTTSVYQKPMPDYDPDVDPTPGAVLHLYAEAQVNVGSSLPTAAAQTNINASTLTLPLLHASQTRALARTSTTIRSLLMYAVKTVKEMRDSWLGLSDGKEVREGASGLGEKWLKHLEGMQAAHGDGSGDALFDLTALLLTGRAPHSLREFFSSGGRLSERVSYCSAFNLAAVVFL
jgi:anaphase-promoting complex subunit 4